MPGSSDVRTPVPPSVRPQDAVQGQWARRVAAALILVSLVITVWSWAIPAVFGLGLRDMPWWRSFFEVNHEVNLAAWWSGVLLAVAAVGFVTVGLLRRALRADRRRALAAWLLPAGLLAVMSLDEFTQLHERAGDLWDALPFTGENPLHAFQWLALGVPAALAVVVTLVLAARSLPRRTAWLTVAGISVFFLGAIVLELVPLLFGLHRGTWLYHTVTHLEELSEMIGSSLLLIAPWGHLHLRADRARGVLDVRADPSRAVAAGRG